MSRTKLAHILLYIQGMMISLLKLKPIPEKQVAVLEILRFVKERSQMEWGCLDSSIYQEWGQDPVILYVEQWQSREAMERHIRSGVYLRVLNTMDLCREKPELRFHEVSDTRGMEQVAVLRLGEESFSVPGST